MFIGMNMLCHVRLCYAMFHVMCVSYTLLFVDNVVQNYTIQTARSFWDNVCQHGDCFVRMMFFLRPPPPPPGQEGGLRDKTCKNAQHLNDGLITYTTSTIIIQRWTLKHTH